MNFKVTVNPLFLIQGIGCGIFGFFDIWLFIMCCSFISEIGQALLCRNGDFTKLCIHFTPIAIKVEDILPTFHENIYNHFIATGISIVIAIFSFGFEYYTYSICSLGVGFIRLFPLLPFEGGKILLNILGKWFGTLKVAEILTKIGLGWGYGMCIFGFFISYIYIEGLLFITIGGYLIFSNKKIFYPIIKKLYAGLAKVGEKPLKEVTVDGTESPQELSFYLNPFEEIFFFAKGKRGVSQQKVIIGILEKEDADWLWKPKRN